MIVCLFLEGDADVCKILRCKLLTIWKKELKVSSATYDPVRKLVKKNIKFLRRVLTRKDLRNIDGGSNNKICNKNDRRRRGVWFIYKGPWALNHLCPGEKEETKADQLETPSNHVNSSIVRFTSFSEENLWRIQAINYKWWAKIPCFFIKTCRTS